jgi:hypothetical protein
MSVVQTESEQRLLQPIPRAGAGGAGLDPAPDERLLPRAAGAPRGRAKTTARKAKKPVSQTRKRKLGKGAKRTPPTTTAIDQVADKVNEDANKQMGTKPKRKRAPTEAQLAALVRARAARAQKRAKGPVVAPLAAPTADRPPKPSVQPHAQSVVPSAHTQHERISTRGATPVIATSSHPGPSLGVSPQPVAGGAVGVGVGRAAGAVAAGAGALGGLGVGVGLGLGRVLGPGPAPEPEEPPLMNQKLVEKSFNDVLERAGLLQLGTTQKQLAEQYADLKSRIDSINTQLGKIPTPDAYTDRDSGAPIDPLSAEGTHQPTSVHAGYKEAENPSFLGRSIDLRHRRTQRHARLKFPGFDPL